MREAVRVHEVTGLVKMQTGPNGGAEIQEVSVEAPTRQLRTYLHFKDLDFQHVYAVRRNVEVVLAQRVIGKVREDQIARLQANVDSYKRHNEQGDLAAFRLLELDFPEDFS